MGVDPFLVGGMAQKGVRAGKLSESVFVTQSLCKKGRSAPSSMIWETTEKQDCAYSTEVQGMSYVFHDNEQCSSKTTVTWVAIMFQWSPKHLRLLSTSIFKTSLI